MNCIIVCILVALAVIEFPKIELLQQQVEEDKKEIEILTDEVREKQEGQIQNLTQQVIKEQQFNFLTLAGTFTLLTCLISLFHMSTHLHKHNQPKIQRKIISILWMSPIYSVTSFITLVFPSVAGWMAIIKDFYESYCIYVFLSFLISVLGEGSRDQAVDVLAKHAARLDNPTRCLACFYEPPPDTSDHAKANAVMTECQIYCLQFTLIRPLTTIFSVFVLHRDQTTKEEEEEYQESNNDDEFKIDDALDGSIDDTISTSSSEVKAASSTLDSLLSPSGSNSNTSKSSIENHDEGNRTRSLINNLQKKKNHQRYAQIRRKRILEEEQQQQRKNGNGEGKDTTSYAADGNDVTIGSTVRRFDNFTDTGEDTMNDDTNNNILSFPSPAPIQESIGITIVPTIAAAIGTSMNSNATTVNSTVGCITDGTFDAMFPTDGPTIEPSYIVPSSMMNETMGAATDFGTNELVNQTKAYFRSPGFAVAMIVNVSIFFAFTGLLKLYHAVRDELLWCRPWPKFLTIKAVVFVTFWQGLAILLWLLLTASPDEQEEAAMTARKYQNLIICLEMLLVAISQWCVFPAEEWEKNYTPRQMHTPGLGIKDFVSDVGQIVNNRSGRSRKEKKRKSRRKVFTRNTKNNSKNTGLYYQPGSASVISSQYDDVDGDENDFDAIMIDTINSSYDSSTNEDFLGDNYPIEEYLDDTNSRPEDAVRDPLEDIDDDRRQRMMSDDTDATGEKADDEDSDDMELV